MDSLTKGALGATIIVMIGAMVLAASNLSKNKDLESENLALKQQILSEQRDREDTKAADTDRRVDETEAQLQALRQEMLLTAEAMRQERLVQAAEREQLSETIDEKVRRERLEDEATMTPLQLKIREAPAIGKVKDVNEELAFIVIGAGSANGIEAGKRYNVRRDKIIVAEVLIDSVVDGSNSIGNVDITRLTPGLNVRPGDDVIGHPIY